MKDEPRLSYAYVSCPSCGQAENTSLILSDCGILWCSCGKVYRLKMEKFIVYECILITDFSD